MRTLVEIIIAAAAVIIISFLSLRLITRHNKELEVPSFTGMTAAQAGQAAMDANLRIDITDSVYINNMGRGVVYKQNPPAGSMVKKNRRILLTINSVNPKLVPMPSVVGFSLRQARAELGSQQLRIGKLIYVRDMATNNVLKQLYNGKEIEPGTPVQTEEEIDLVVGLSDSDNTTYVPHLTALQFLAAKDAILDNSMNIGGMFFDETVTDYADSLSAYVYKQYPEFDVTCGITGTEPKPLRIGSQVNIYLTRDRSKVEEALLKEDEMARAAEEAKIAEEEAKALEKELEKAISEIEKLSI